MLYAETNEVDLYVKLSVFEYIAYVQIQVQFLFCNHLQYAETNEVDPYVKLSVFDPETGGTEAFKTSVQMNDASPRWVFV